MLNKQNNSGVVLIMSKGGDRLERHGSDTFSFVFFHLTAAAEHWCLKTQKKTAWDAALAALVCHRL